MDQIVEQKTEVSSDGANVLKSVCRSCHGGCGVLLHVKDDVLVKVTGDPDSPFNQGRLCPIGNATKEIVYHPDRLKYPMRRKGERGSGEWGQAGPTWFGESAEQVLDLFLGGFRVRPSKLFFEDPPLEPLSRPHRAAAPEFCIIEPVDKV